MKSELRWIEIKFSTLCLNLYKNLADYVAVTSFIELLADLCKMDRLKALKLLSKTFQDPLIRPSKPEFVCIAKQHKVTIETILKCAHISKTHYIELMHTIDLDYDYPPHCAPSEIEGMEQLLNAYNKLKGLTI